ncbi:hypothetical protein Gotur_010266 [Gossypium turneri]
MKIKNICQKQLMNVIINLKIIKSKQD